MGNKASERLLGWIIVDLQTTVGKMKNIRVYFLFFRLLSASSALEVTS